MRGPRLLPADINRMIDETLQLYAGVLQQGTVDARAAVRRRAAARAASTLEQMRQVVINLVDNAIEALGGPHGAARGRTAPPPTITIATTHDG